jgi:hypothetical protein
MAENTALKSQDPPAHTWLLLLDHLEFADLHTVDDRPQLIPDPVQARAVCFEQYYLQDSRQSMATAEMASELMKAILAALPASVRCQIISGDGPYQAQVMQRLRPEHQARVLWTAVKSTDLSAAVTQADANCDFHVCLMSSQALRESGGLADVVATIDGLGSNVSRLHTPRILITGLQGRRSVEQSGQPAADDAQMHLPLLYCADSLQTDIVQGVCGSGDLPCTVAELLNSERPMNRSEQTSSQHYLQQPMSLLDILRNVPGPANRLLPIQGDDWQAWRTQTCLVWQPTQTEQDRVTTAPHLYLKPEDRWNRNDLSGTYAVTLDEIVRAAAHTEERVDTFPE